MLLLKVILNVNNFGIFYLYCFVLFLNVTFLVHTVYFVLIICSIKVFLILSKRLFDIVLMEDIYSCFMTLSQVVVKNSQRKTTNSLFKVIQSTSNFNDPSIT